MPPLRTDTRSVFFEPARRELRDAPGLVVDRDRRGAEDLQRRVAEARDHARSWPIRRAGMTIR